MLKLQKQTGFTIVELLVVIVVIGILAAITIVSYAGISQKATIASIKSDLTSSVQKLKLYYTDNGTYPQSLDGSNCPQGPSDSLYCLSASKIGGTLTTYTYTSSSPYSTFILLATNGSNVYTITERTSPVVYVPPTTFSFYISGDGTLKPTSTGVTANSWERGTATSETVTVWLDKVSSGGTETQLATASRSISNDSGSNYTFSLPVTQTMLDYAGKLRLKVNDGYGVVSFDYSLGGTYTQINASIVTANLDCWAYYDTNDGVNYNGFAVGNPDPFRPIVTRLNNVVLN